MDDLQRLFLDVVDLESGQRSQYFEKSGVTPELRTQVESLLRFDDDSEGSIESVIADTVEHFLDSAPERFCGPYELVRLLGRGGMGSVYLAQRKDGEVDLQVAIKLIGGGIASTPVFRERFLQERQILASLNHPGITRLLDAGHTRGGQPYLVMEYVDGTPIDIYCRGLAFEQKLKLFLSVCEAIAYLHRHLVIHRDLKPSNILIEAGGAPKILDFGLAKILDEAADGAATKERLLTPDYASPEQVKGTAKTTATDVYSLGALLYKLAGGRSPHITETELSIDEVICTVDAVPLRRLDASLPRDLDFIIQKALRKEPAERYTTVDAFADDLRAVLESRPVNVRAGNTWYKARKFARRRWIPLSAVAAVIISLTAGLYVASRERALAQRRFAQVQRLANRVLALDGEIRGLPGGTKARQQVVSVSMEYLDGLEREAGNDLKLKLDAANGYMLTAELQGVPIIQSLGQFKEAQQSLQKAIGLVDDVLRAAPNRQDALLLGAEIEQDRTIVLDTQHEWPDATVHAARSTGYCDRLTRLPGISEDEKLGVARIYLNIGQAHMNMHQYDAAIADMARGIELGRSTGTASRMVAQGLSALANARRQSGDLTGALSAITEARALSEKMEFSDDTLRATTLYAILWRQGVILGEDESVNLNRPADALEPLEKAFDLVDRMAARDANDFSFRNRMGTAGQQLGDILRHTDPARALVIYDRTIQRLREVKPASSARGQLARVLAHSSYPLRSLHRNAEAKQRIDQAFKLLAEDPSAVGIIGGEWDNTMRASADDQEASGNAEKARATLLDLQSKLLALGPTPETDLRHANDISRLYDSLLRVDAKLGKYDEARAVQTERMKLWRLWDGKLPGNAFVKRQIEKPLPTIPAVSAK
jgi:serine/threonine protein kinase